MRHLTSKGSLFFGDTLYMEPDPALAKADSLISPYMGRIMHRMHPVTSNVLDDQVLQKKNLLSKLSEINYRRKYTTCCQRCTEKGNASLVLTYAFIFQRMALMKRLDDHPNVINLVGCVSRTEPYMVLITYVPNGDLLGYLRKSRGGDDKYFNDPDIKPSTDLTSKHLIRFAKDIACGMEFLALNKVVHRDLAARNILLDGNLVCKVTDFGMARNVKYTDEIYTRISKTRIPVKWTAIESLMYGKCTSYSDVWSYGIVLFEIFTIGGRPYPRVKGPRVYTLLKDGYRMDKPKHVNEELYSVMLQCWNSNPEERPSFSVLQEIMSKMEMKHEVYVNLSLYGSALYENMSDTED